MVDAAQLLGSQSDGFNQLLGTEYVEITADRVVLRCAVTPALLQPHGILHGGVYCSLGETAASVAGALWLADRGRVVGVANHTNFLAAARDGVLTATALPVHRGRSQQLWRTEITQDDRTMAICEVRLANLSAPTAS
jgi:1,4-dihydroxy-2-naphthoyl-CoA hydrolase